MSQLNKFDFNFKHCSQIDVEITLADDDRGAIFGVVKDYCGRPVKDAVVKLLCKKRRFPPIGAPDGLDDALLGDDKLEGDALGDADFAEDEVDAAELVPPDCGCPHCCCGAVMCGGCCDDAFPIAHAFTDHCGQFVFGPLCRSAKYQIIVWVNDTRCCREAIHFHGCNDCLSCCEPCCDCCGPHYGYDQGGGPDGYGQDGDDEIK